MAAHASPRSFRWPLAGCAKALLGGITALLAVSGAQAQMVPHTEHAWRQSASSDLSTARINWNGTHAAEDSGVGQGLTPQGQGLWPHWEGRIGVVIDRPVNPLKDTFLLARPQESGLRVRSLHILSDYYVEGGFRATAGFLRGETGQAWWSSGDNGGGLNLSLQRLDSLGLLGNLDARARANAQDGGTSTYVGAGYSTRLNTRGSYSPWRFNADLGLITINSNNIGRITQVLQGERRIEDIARDLRLRTIVKLSVGYAF